MQISGSDVAAVLAALGASGGQCLPAADLALGATGALRLTTASPVGVCCWLATLTQESAFFRTTKEYGTGQAYAPYVGRTFEQVTWKANYQAFGAWCVRKGFLATADLFVDRPELLSEMQWAWLGGAWFFADSNLWTYADRGDFQAVSNAVNRGNPGAPGFPSGWTSRLAAYRAWTTRCAPPDQLTVNGALDTPTSRRLQQWVGVAMDGTIGQRTREAIQKWIGVPVDGTLSSQDIKKLQAEVGAFVDGDWGPGTTRDLQDFLNKH